MQLDLHKIKNHAKSAFATDSLTTSLARLLCLIVSFSQSRIRSQKGTRQVEAYPRFHFSSSIACSCLFGIRPGRLSGKKTFAMSFKFWGPTITLLVEAVAKLSELPQCETLHIICHDSSYDSACSKTCAKAWLGAGNHHVVVYVNAPWALFWQTNLPGYSPSLFPRKR